MSCLDVKLTFGSESMLVREAKDILSRVTKSDRGGLIGLRIVFTMVTGKGAVGKRGDRSRQG